MRGVRTFAAYAAVGGVSLLTLAALHAIADRFPNAGVGEIRDYLVRPNG